jgi:hypothetical protein
MGGCILDRFIKKIKKYSLQNVLYTTSKLSGEFFREHNSGNFAVLFEDVHVVTNGITRKHQVWITIWSLIDFSFNAVIYTNDYRSMSLTQREELVFLITLCKECVDQLSAKQPFAYDPNLQNEFMIFLHGFAGEQFKAQNPAQVFDNYCRGKYILGKIGSQFNDGIDVEKIVISETGLSSDQVSQILLLLWSISTRTPYILDEIGDHNTGNFSNKDIQSVVKYYSTNYEEIRKSSIGRQILYSKPFILTDTGKYISSNALLVLFLYENSTYWIIRDYFLKSKKQDFVNAFGIYFETYMKELFELYLDKTEFSKIAEVSRKRADWRLIIDDFVFLIEQKSAFVGLNVKQQNSDIDQAKRYLQNNLVEAIKQLKSTEDDFHENNNIKIILVYEDYYKAELLDYVFSLPELGIINDNYYWLVSIDEMESLLFVLKQNKELFRIIISEKIEAELCKSNEGRSLGQIMERNGILDNKHIKQEQYRTNHENNYNVVDQNLGGKGNST